MRIKSGYGLIFLCLLTLIFWGMNCSDNSTNPGDDIATGDTSGTVDSTDTTSDTTTDTTGNAGIIADHRFAVDPATIATATLDQIRNDYNIFYGHTSHGSQIVTGISMLASEDNRYNSPSIHEITDDLGQSGDTSWVPPTRSWLDGHPQKYN